MSNCTLKTITINTDTHKVVPLEPTENQLIAIADVSDCPGGMDVEIYKAMLAAAPEYKQLWLPIETAPKDGTLILVGLNGRTTEIAKFYDEWWVDDGEEYSVFFEPSHWLPNIEAPEEI